MEDIQDHHKRLLMIINQLLNDNLSRYLKASEITEQMIKSCCENTEDNSVDGFLLLLREVIPRESISTRKLIKGALLQSEIL